jgi:hypothetical protein
VLPACAFNMCCFPVLLLSSLRFFRTEKVKLKLHPPQVSYEM